MVLKLIREPIDASDSWLSWRCMLFFALKDNNFWDNSQRETVLIIYRGQLFTNT